jgi:hypothetical protein
VILVRTHFSVNAPVMPPPRDPATVAVSPYDRFVVYFIAVTGGLIVSNLASKTDGQATRFRPTKHGSTSRTHDARSRRAPDHSELWPAATNYDA